MNFVSEKEIEKTRTNGTEPEEPIDSRPLYERLKELRDKKQLEIDESRKLKNQFRGLDTDETDFLDLVDKVKEEQELKKKQDEEAILRECRKVTSETASVPSLDDIKPSTTIEATTKRPSKQATLLSSAIRKRKHSDEPPQEPTKKFEQEPIQPMGKQSTAMKLVGILPGIGDYSASSDDEDNSDSSESGDELILPSLQSNLIEKDNANGATPNKSTASVSKCGNSGTSSTSQT